MQGYLSKVNLEFYYAFATLIRLKFPYYVLIEQPLQNTRKRFLHQQQNSRKLLR